MKRIAVFSTILALTTACGALQAHALDLSRYTPQEQTVITKNGPAYGGVIIRKTQLIYPQAAPVQMPAPAPVAALQAIEPAAGSVNGIPVNDIPDVDLKTVGGASYEHAVNRFHTLGVSYDPLKDDAEPRGAQYLQLTTGPSPLP